MDNYKQLYEKTNEEYKGFYPLTDILSIIDKESGKNLKQLLNQYNHIKLDWKGSTVDTRNSVPLILRHKGLFVTYDNGTSVITEFYKGEDISVSINSIWQNDNNWTDLSPGVSLADNEDIAEIDGKLKFADRNYNPAQFTGMGRVILRKNLTDVGGGAVKNVLTQDMINKSNTIYEVRYDFDLGGKTLEVPSNCILDFQGGSFENGTIVGNSTYIVENRINIFRENITIEGTFINKRAISGWFKNKNNSLTKCFKISNYVLVSENGSYGHISLIGNSLLDVNGKSITVSSITVIGNNNYININGGELGGSLGGGLVAETVTGGNTFVAQEGHSFFVGQTLHSSKDVGAKTTNFFGSANNPLANPVLITEVNGNNITINKNLGSYTLHKGLGLGNFSWTNFIYLNEGKLKVYNGIIKNCYAYVCKLNGDENTHVIFKDVEFLNLGLDSFSVNKYGTLELDNCYISKPLDYAKSTIMLYQGNIIVRHCKIEGGNYDYFIGCWAGLNPGDDTITHGKIIIEDSDFNGIKLDEDGYVRNNLHCIGYQKNGTLDKLVIRNCTFNNYERQVISSSTLASDYNITIGNIHISNCDFGTCGFLNFNTSSFKVVENFSVNNCIFRRASVFLGQIVGYDKSITFNNCIFYKIRSVDQIVFYCNVDFITCTFINIEVHRKVYRWSFRDCVFNAGVIYYNTESDQNFNDVYDNCTIGAQIQVIGGIVRGIHIKNSTLNHKIPFMANNGTNVGNIFIANCIVDSGVEKVINVIGWSLGIKLYNICSNGTLTANKYYVGGGDITYKYCEGIE